MRKQIMLLSAGLLFLASCNSDRVFSETKKFDNNRWAANNFVSFSAEIENIDCDYEIIFTISHVYEGISIPELPVKINFISPSGKKQEKLYNIGILKGKEHIGSCSGDYCDVEQVLEEKFKFEEKGKYSIEISQNSGYDPLPNVMQIGLKIDEVK